MNRLRGPLLSVALAAGAQFAFAHAVSAGPHDALISKHAAANGVPEALIRRVIHIESRGNPRAVSKGNYGLMQIRLGTARALGYLGTAEGLLDADTNMTYAVRYLANAYRAAGCSISRAIAYYQRGFYKKPQMRCATTTAVSSRDPALDAAELRGSLARSDDVLKPRVVHIEKITRSPHATTSHHAVVTGQPAAKFDPVRLAPQEAAATLDSTPTPALSAKSGSAMAMPPMPRSRPALLARSSSTADGTRSVPAPEAASADRVAILEPQAVPLPPARPEITPKTGPASKTEPATRHTRHTTPRHARTGKRKAAETSGVVSFLEKLSAPQKKSHPQRRQPKPINPYAPPVY